MYTIAADASEVECVGDMGNAASILCVHGYTVRSCIRDGGCIVARDITVCNATAMIR